VPAIKKSHPAHGLRTYGLEIPTNIGSINQLDIELKCFAEGRSEELGGQGKAQHFKNIIQLSYSWVWKYWHEWNELMLWAWCNYEEIGMTGAASCHKTFTFSLLGMTEFLACPMETAVIMSSKTVPSLRTRLWAQIKKFWIGAGYIDSQGKLNRFSWPYNIVDSKTTIQFVKGDDEHAIRAVAVDSGPVEQALGKIIGSHPGRVVMMVDEAAQTNPAIFAARANLATGTKFFRFVAIANAVSQFDGHGKFCEPKRGWSTVSVDSESWETRTGICLHFDGLKSPNVQAGEDKYPSLFNLRAIEKIRNDHGENSLEWWSQCRGFWPPSGVRNTVLDAAMIIAGNARDKATWERSHSTYAALDPAFTTGGDRCILRFARFGKFADGTQGMELFDVIHIKLSNDGRVPINYQIADRVKEECLARNVPPERFGFDATSASGLSDMLNQRWSSSIRPVQFGGKPPKTAVGEGDRRLASDVYYTKVTWLWFVFQKMVTAKRVRGLDDETAQEFCSRMYLLKDEKTKVESKEDMKMRTAGVSPDLADPCVILAWMFNSEHGVDGKTEEQQAESENNWHQMARRHNIPSRYAA
jgi:hypothetical protein